MDSVRDELKINGASDDVEPEQRATSNDIRILIRQLLRDGLPHAAAEIKNYVVQALSAENKFFGRGQLAGCYTNLCKSGEIQNLDRGIYIMGPTYEKRTSYYENKQKIYSYQSKQQLPTYLILEEEKNKNEELRAVCSSVVTQLKKQNEFIGNQLDKIKLSQISGNDLRFIMELKELEESIRAFCVKYEK